MYIHFCCCPCVRYMFEMFVCFIHTPLDFYTALSLNHFWCEWIDCNTSVPFFLEFIVVFCSCQFVLKGKERQIVSLWDWRLKPCMNLVNPEHEQGCTYSMYIFRKSESINEITIQINKIKNITFFFIVLVAHYMRENILRVAPLCFASKLHKIIMLFIYLIKTGKVEFYYFLKISFFCFLFK